MWFKEVGEFQLLRPDVEMNGYKHQVGFTENSSLYESVEQRNIITSNGTK